MSTEASLPTRLELECADHGIDTWRTFLGGWVADLNYEWDGEGEPPSGSGPTERTAVDDLRDKLDAIRGRG